MTRWGGEIAPANRAIVVVPSDTVVFVEGECEGIYVGVAGDVVALVAGVAVQFTGVPAGTVLAVRATRVNATNTDATDMVALYTRG